MSTSVVRSCNRPERFLTSLDMKGELVIFVKWNERKVFCGRTVSQICSFTGWPSIWVRCVPNSTPIVNSWSGWYRRSVNCKSKQDLPTPVGPTTTAHFSGTSTRLANWHGRWSSSQMTAKPENAKLKCIIRIIVLVNSRRVWWTHYTWTLNVLVAPRSVSFSKDPCRRCNVH